jgi:hypothetical protein
MMKAASPSGMQKLSLDNSSLLASDGINTTDREKVSPRQRENHHQAIELRPE